MRILSRGGFIALAAISLLAISLATPAHGAVTFVTASLAAQVAVSETRPEAHGEWVAYQTATPLIIGSHTNVVMHNVRTGAIITVGGGDSADQTNPDTSGGRMVYEDDTAGNKDVRVYDALLGVDFPVASTSSDEVLPRISGNLVAWRNANTGELWYRDLSRGNTAKVPSASNVTAFDVDNGTIVWGEALVEEHLYYYEPGDSVAAMLLYTAPSTMDIGSVRVHGEDVVADTTISGMPKALRFKIGTPTAWMYSNNTSNPTVFHDTVAFQFTNTGSQEDIRWVQHEMGDATMGSPSLDDRRPSMFGRRIAFERATGPGNTDIYLGVSNLEIARTEGSNRYRTAIQTSRAYFSAALYAIICTGENFPDALAAGPLANAMDAPLLLTRRDSISAETLGELSRLGVKHTIVVGGQSAVSDAVIQQLSINGHSPWRLAGKDRYETSAFIAELMAQEIYHGAYAVDMAFFARGDDFADALAVGPVASGALSPIMLVKTGSVPASVANAVDQFNITSGVIVGGSDVVSNDVRDDLAALMQANGGEQHPIERWAGDDRYATATEVIDNGLAARWIDLDTVGVATGLNFPDALGAGAALGHYGSPLLLVRTASVPGSVQTWMAANKRAIGRMDIFGGTDVVSDNVTDQMRSLLQ